MGKILKILAASISIFFFINVSSYGLATLPASQNPRTKSKILAYLNRNLVRYAESEDEIKLLKDNATSCLLLSSGKYLIDKNVATDDIKLIRVLIHESIEALMQVLAAQEQDKYNSIKVLILKHLPPPKEAPLSPDLYVNHIIAKVFEWQFLVDEDLIKNSQIPHHEKYLYNKISPVILANRHNYFTEEFWDVRVRTERITSAIADGARFYQVAIGDILDVQTREMFVQFATRENSAHSALEYIYEALPAEVKEEIEIVFNAVGGKDVAEDCAFFLEMLLAVRAEDLGFNTFDEYADFLQNGSVEAFDELNDLQHIFIRIARYSRASTMFNRFNVTKLRAYLKDLISEKVAKGDLSLTAKSLGISSGEEPYSIAFSIYYAIRDHYFSHIEEIAMPLREWMSQWDICIQAYDNELINLILTKRGYFDKQYSSPNSDFNDTTNPYESFPELFDSEIWEKEIVRSPGVHFVFRNYLIDRLPSERLGRVGLPFRVQKFIRDWMMPIYADLLSADGERIVSKGNAEIILCAYLDGSTKIPAELRATLSNCVNPYYKGFLCSGRETEEIPRKINTVSSTISQDVFVSDTGSYDADSSASLLLDILHGSFHEDRVYLIKYDVSRLSRSQINIVEAYIDLLKQKSQKPANIKKVPFSSKMGSTESLFAVYCKGKDFESEGHVDVTISEGEIGSYFLRIPGMLNIAIAASTIPQGVTTEELTSSYAHIVGFIKQQYKDIMGQQLHLSGSVRDMLMDIRYMILNLPKAYKMPVDKLEENNRLMREALISA